MVQYQITPYRQRAINPHDIESLLVDVFIGEGYTDGATRNRFSIEQALSRGEVLVAHQTESGQVLGVAIAVAPTNTARQAANSDESEIQLLAVRPVARGRGVASALVAPCEQVSTGWGYEKIVLSTQLSMKAAHRVYERCGYAHYHSRDWSRNGKSYLVYGKVLS
jgi:GNAT superfamily N-acetyltransferase